MCQQRAPRETEGWSLFGCCPFASMARDRKLRRLLKVVGSVAHSMRASVQANDNLWLQLSFTATVVQFRTFHRLSAAHDCFWLRVSTIGLRVRLWRAPKDHVFRHRPVVLSSSVAVVLANVNRLEFPQLDRNTQHSLHNQQAQDVFKQGLKVERRHEGPTSRRATANRHQ